MTENLNAILDKDSPGALKMVAEVHKLSILFDKRPPSPAKAAALADHRPYTGRFGLQPVPYENDTIFIIIKK